MSRRKRNNNKLKPVNKPRKLEESRALGGDDRRHVNCMYSIIRIMTTLCASSWASNSRSTLCPIFGVQGFGRVKKKKPGVARNRDEHAPDLDAQDVDNDDDEADQRREALRAACIPDGLQLRQVRECAWRGRAKTSALAAVQIERHSIQGGHVYAPAKMMSAITMPLSNKASDNIEWCSIV